MYTLIEVTTRQHETDFLELPDIRNVFDPAKNPCFQNGECIRWILKDETGQCVGRVAAFINRKTCHLDKYSVGQMGFFECIDDRQAAFCLFDKCREWLEGKGMEAMEGPVNFGERIEWWGLLVDGFDQSPVYAMPYTQPYYVSFFENKATV